MNGFPKDARVCFIGDSITHDNGFISRIVAFYNKHCKERNVNFYNCGIGGAHVDTVFPILERDVLSHNPTHAVIMYGMNDSERSLLSKERTTERYGKLIAAFELYKNNLSKLCDRLKEHGVEIILCTPTPYDEYQSESTDALRGGYALIKGYADYVMTFANEKGFAVCDFNGYLTAKMQERVLINTDRVHPNEDGHYCMAECFLRFQGFDEGVDKEIPEYLDRWRKLVQIHRDIHMTEYFIVKDYSLTDAQRLEKVKEYIENKLDNNDRGWFFKLTKSYMENKPHQSEIENELNTIMENKE